MKGEETGRMVDKLYFNNNIILLFSLYFVVFNAYWRMLQTDNTAADYLINR